MSDLHNQRFQLDRVAFFSDAVFAIAITLLVIEIHVPELPPGHEGALGQALLELVPKYVGFVVSFLVIGRFWLGHHRVFGLLQRTDESLIARNQLLLMAIAFGPFPTALLSDYASDRVAVLVYAGWLIATGLLSRRVSGYGVKSPQLWSPGVGAAAFERLRWGSWVPIIAGVLAAGVGAIVPVLALVPLIASPLIGLALARIANRTGAQGPQADAAPL